MIARLQMWWHRRQGHAIRRIKVSVPLWDISAKGYLYECSCDRTWAR